MTQITYLPGIRVGIYDWNEEVKEIRLATLAAWVIGLRSELKGYPVTSQPILPMAKRFLGVPKHTPSALILKHLETSYENIKEQLGMQA